MAIPFLPFLIKAAPTIVSMVGKLAGGASKQRAEDRGAQGEYDAMRVPIANAQNLQYADARRAAERQRMREIMGSTMLSAQKPPSDPRAQKFDTGGRLDEDAIEMVRSRAHKALQTGSDVPQIQTMPDKPGGGPTGMDRFLNILNMAGTAVGGLREAGIMGNDYGRTSSVNAPADLEASIYGTQQQDDVPWWSPLARRGN